VKALLIKMSMNTIDIAELELAAKV